MKVYVGFGQDPLWMMGPAFWNTQDNDVRRTPRTAPVARQESKEDLAASWETIPVPRSRRAANVTIYNHYEGQQPTLAAAAPNNGGGGILAALLRWLQG